MGFFSEIYYLTFGAIFDQHNSGGKVTLKKYLGIILLLTDC